MKEKDTQTYKIQEEVMKVFMEFPEKKKDEKITIVLDRMGMKADRRPTVRRCKSMLIEQYKAYIKMLE